MSSPQTTEQRVDHLTDAIGDLSRNQRILVLDIREIHGLIGQLDVKVDRLSITIEEIQSVQADHSARLGRIEAVQADHTERLERIETVLVEILSRLPERPTP